jgi:hypothetical protein
MGLFRKKADPLAQRAQPLNRRIAELEAEIAKLNQTLTPNTDQQLGSASAHPFRNSATSPTQAIAAEPVFEQMPARPLDPRPPDSPGREAMEMGLKRPNWSQWIRRFKGRLVDPPPANEKLINYLAAGGLQGLRPLRYERRVARNRIIFVCVVLGLLLWGILVVFWQTR